MVLCIITQHWLLLFSSDGNRSRVGRGAQRTLGRGERVWLTGQDTDQGGRTGSPLGYEQYDFLDCVLERRRLGLTGSLAQPSSSLIFAPTISHHMSYFSVTLFPEEWGKLHTLDNPLSLSRNSIV